MLLIFDLDGTLFQAKPVVRRVGLDASQPEYSELLRSAIRECGELFPDVREMLAQLRDAGHELVICSKSPMEYIEIVLEHTKIAEFFTRHYSSERYTSKAEIVREIIALGNYNAAVIGDTHGDISAARENGLPSIAAVYGYGNKSMLGQADYFASTPLEIAKCVSDLTQHTNRNNSHPC